MRLIACRRHVNTDPDVASPPEGQNSPAVDIADRSGGHGATAWPRDRPTRPGEITTQAAPKFATKQGQTGASSGDHTQAPGQDRRPARRSCSTPDHRRLSSVAGQDRCAISVQLARVTSGQSRLLPVAQSGWSAASSATICPIPKLIVRVRFPSPAPMCRAQAGDDIYRLGLDRFGVLVVCPFQAVSGLRNVSSRKNGIDTHS